MCLLSLHVEKNIVIFLHYFVASFRRFVAYSVKLYDYKKLMHVRFIGLFALFCVFHWINGKEITLTIIKTEIIILDGLIWKSISAYIQQ